MKRLSSILTAIAAFGIVAGCGKNPTGPGGGGADSAVVQVVVAPATDTVAVGEFAFFTATAYDTGGLVVNAPVAWSTSDPTICTVNGTGRVSAISEGEAFVIARSGIGRDSATVVVTAAADGWFSQVSNANGANLNGVFFLADGRTGWAVGDAGKILRTKNAGTTWTAQTSNTAFNLQGVWFTSASEGWAVGAGGTVMHTTNAGVIWTRAASGASEVLYDVAFLTPDVGWVVGGSGVVLRTIDGGDHWLRSVPTPSTLRGVSFAGLDGWAVGDGGVILGTHDAGLSWFRVQPAVTSQRLTAVWRRSEPFAVAVGNQGVAPRTEVGPDSTRWVLENAGAANSLEGVCFATDLIGFAVGSNGAGIVLRSDDGGQSWQSQIANTQSRLNDVFFVDERRGWAVGDGGIILHTGSGGALP